MLETWLEQLMSQCSTKLIVTQLNETIKSIVKLTSLFWKMWNDIQFRKLIKVMSHSAPFILFYFSRFNKIIIDCSNT